MGSMSEHHTHEPHTRIDPYEADTPMWSGEPNGALVDEVAALAPGRALDVGAGEGADAVWLAQRGWRVTAVEPSANALVRARAAAQAAGVEVTWVESTLADADLPDGGFDLVCASYPALFREPDTGVERALARLVAPGGTLSTVHHGDVDRERALSHGFDPDQYVSVPEIRDHLRGAGWTLDTDATRERDLRSGNGAHHHVDLVVRARRP